MEALAVVGLSSSCSLSSPSSGSETEKLEELDSDLKSKGRLMKSLCFLVILQIHFGCGLFVADIWKVVSIGWHIEVLNITCMSLHKNYERKVL